MTSLHSVGSLGECLNNQFLVLLTPSSHLRIRINDRVDVVDDVFLLSSLVVKRYMEGCQRLKGVLYVDLEAACNTYVQILEVAVDETLDNIEDFFPSSWYARVV